jgi:hypothetical protein
MFEDKECSVDGVWKTMNFMLHLWVMAYHRNELPTIEKFFNICSLYIS